MSKMKDMAMTIEELRSAAAAINDVADWLTQQFSGNADEPKEQPKKEPDLKRPFETKAGPFVGAMAMLVALFFLWLYLPGLGSPSPLTGIEWGLCGGWLVLGIILFLINKAGKNGKAAKEDIEYLMFGNEYKRF